MIELGKYGCQTMAAWKGGENLYSSKVEIKSATCSTTILGFGILLGGDAVMDYLSSVGG